jgi:hypothetical protein
VAARFLKLTVFFFLVALLAVLALNVIIDPFGVSPIKVAIGGINEPKVFRSRVDRLVKPYDVLLRRPATVIFGSSRVKQAFDPEHLAGSRFAPAYNAGIDWATLSEGTQLLEQQIRVGATPRHVFVEIVINTFFFPGTPRWPTTFSEHARNLASIYLSLSAVAASAYTVARGRSSAPFNQYLLPNGLVANVKHETAKDFLVDFPKRWAATPRSRYIVDDQLLEQLEAYRRLCAENGIELAFFIAPYHSVYLYLEHERGHWPDIENFKRALARYGDVYDFTGFDRFSTEPVADRMRYWNDVNHFSIEVGNYILDVLTDRRSGDLPPGFGLRLTPSNVESHLESLHAARDRWISENRAFLERIEAVRNQATRR